MSPGEPADPLLDAGGADPRACESTVRRVFGLIWPDACIDCRRDAEDDFIVGLSEGSMRHVVRVPRALVAFDAGLALVRAVYKSGLPAELGRAQAAQACSL